MLNKIVISIHYIIDEPENAGIVFVAFIEFDRYRLLIVFVSH